MAAAPSIGVIPRENVGKSKSSAMEIGVSAAGRALHEVGALAPQRCVTPGLHPLASPIARPELNFFTGPTGYVRRNAGRFTAADF